jgi:hypothetical protein
MILNTQSALFITTSLCVLLAFCRKSDSTTTQLKPNKSSLQFLDYTTGNPISNLEVKRWNFRDSSNGGTYLIYKDSFHTDGEGNCIFDKSEANDYISWSSDDYFDDDLEVVPGNGVPRTNSLFLLKTEENISYYQAKLFPKIEVTIHIKQLTPIQPDSTSPGTYLYLSALAYNNGTARNEISLVTEQQFLPKCNACPDKINYLVIKKNELLDIKVKGFLAKNYFNSMKFFVSSTECCIDPIIVKQGILPLENRIIGPQTEILFTF